MKGKMNKEYFLMTPLDDDIVAKLHAGDKVYLSGVLYTARDIAHKRLVELLKNNKALPFDINGAIIYYTGPAPTKPGHTIGSCGPTTSYRMDDYTEDLLQVGLKGMIGKGERNSEVALALKKHVAVYFAATGGAGALYSKVIKDSEIIAYDDLGPEAIRKLTVENFPVIVAQDCHGNNIYSR